MAKTIVVALAIAIALSACAEAPVSEFDSSNEYGDGVGRNFHRWCGKVGQSCRTAAQAPHPSAPSEGA
jgi:hypothetical protein